MTLARSTSMSPMPEELTADEVRRIGSVQRTLTEMGRGERFVMGYLRTRAREPRKRLKCSGLVSGRSLPGDETSSA